METQGCLIPLEGTITHGSYLQGMETDFANGAFVRVEEHGSYLQGMETFPQSTQNSQVAPHGSYLQGMETHLFDARWFFPSHLHGSYLQGMETLLDGYDGDKLIGTDPTYKEWKPSM